MAIEYGSDGRKIEGYDSWFGKRRQKISRKSTPRSIPTHNRSCASDVYLHSIVEEKRKEIGEILNEEEQQQLDNLLKEVEHSLWTIPENDIMMRRIHLSPKGEAEYVEEATKIVEGSNIPFAAKNALFSRIRSSIPIKFADNLRNELRRSGVRKIEFASVLEVIIPINRLLCAKYRLYGIRVIPQTIRPISKSSVSKPITSTASRNSIKDRIVDYLRKKPHRLAKEIASSIGESTHDVNSCIYRELRNILKQDAKYRWSFK